MVNEKYSSEDIKEIIDGVIEEINQKERTL